MDGERAHTREAKLGYVFSQNATDPQGRPRREEASTTYTGAIESAEEFGRRLYTGAQPRGWNRARQRVVMGDGAAWIWNLADEHFPGALQIVDLYHARQHLWNLAVQLFPSRPARRQAWTRRLQSKTSTAVRSGPWCSPHDRRLRPTLNSLTSSKPSLHYAGSRELAPQRDRRKPGNILSLSRVYLPVLPTSRRLNIR